jgi:hypothetical protein
MWPPAPYGYASARDAALDMDEDDWATPENVKLVPVIIGKEVIGYEEWQIQPWMVECEYCGMMSGTHFCDGNEHEIGWKME